MCNQCQQYLMRNKIVSHDGHIHIKTLSHSHLKQTTLCIPQQALTPNNKLDPSHLLICKTYSSIHKLSADAVQRWIDRLSQLPNCNPIVSYHLQTQHSQQSTATLSIYEKYLRDSNLGELIDEQWQVDWQLIINLAQSVRQLHKEGMYLGALKPENILLDKQQRKITFTDLRMPFAHCMTSNKQSISTNKMMNGQGRGSSDRMSSNLYVAPQIKKGNYYDQAADIYSLGVILLELVRHQRMQQLLNNNQLRSSQAGKEHQLEKLAARMMKEDMLQRPTIQEVLDELSRIHQGRTHADSFICKQTVALYLPLNHISPKFDICKSTFREAFSRIISDRVVDFQIDEYALFLKSKLQLGAIVLMSVIAEQELGRDIMQYFRSMRELYEYLSNCNGVSLTATAMLRFNYPTQQNPSTTRTGNKQSREPNNAKRCLVNQMELTSDSTSQETTPL